MTVTLIFAMTYGVTLLAAVASLAFDAFGRRGLALGAVSAGLAIAALGGIGSGIERATTGRIGSLGVGGPSSAVFGVIALVGLLAVMGGLDSLKTRPGGGSTAGLIALSVAASGAAAASLDLITLVLTLEMAALCGYGLVALARTRRSGEAAMKYFVQGAVATGLLLFGTAVLIGLLEPTGHYDAFAETFATTSVLLPALAGVGLLIAGLLFKMGAVPFHSWAPDAYETAPVESAAFLATGPKLAAIAAAAVLLSIASSGALAERLIIVVAGLAVVSILVGSVAALRQRSYRRLLAYAGIAQVGYALIAVALFNPPLAVFFGATYAIASVGTFTAAAAFERLVPGWDGSVAGLAGVARRAPVLCGSLALLLVSLSGLPPLLGFWGKLLVFATGISAAGNSGSVTPGVGTMLAVSVGAGILGSAVSLGYYGGILRTLYFDAASEPDGEVTTAREDTDSAQWAVFVVVATAILVAIVSVAPVLLGANAIQGLFAAV